MNSTLIHTPPHFLSVFVLSTIIHQVNIYSINEVFILQILRSISSHLDSVSHIQCSTFRTNNQPNKHHSFLFSNQFNDFNVDLIAESGQPKNKLNKVCKNLLQTQNEQSKQFCCLHMQKLPSVRINTLVVMDTDEGYT